MAAATEKVFVALPAEFKAGQSTLSWVLSHFGGSGATVVITHVHVPPQMIPVMGVKFHSSKLSPEQVKLFRRIEREKVNTQLDGYVHQCSRMKVKCEKLVFEKEDVVAGLVELIVLHRVTRLVISAAADRQYSSFGFRKMDKPKSTKATEIMQRADPSCKIWFICKGHLICTRGKEVDTAPSVTLLLPDSDHQTLQLVPYEKEDDVQSELGLYDELKEACIAAENLMKRALNESSRRQKADEEVLSALQKANEYQELYWEEVRKRQELEEALARANREIAQLRQANHLPMDEQNASPDELQEAISEELTFERRIVDMDAVLAAAGQVTEPQKEHVHVQIDLDTGGRELQALLSQCKPTAFSPSSVIQSPYDEDCIPSYFLCPILQEPMRDPHVAADGFTYEADAIRGWLDGGSDASPVTGQPLAHRELAPNFALGAVIQDYTMRRRQHRFS
ncbi:U-box domain-containing protein 33-like isoform X1 [Panicum miliaceum]|uniref:RING-type E3 ubiquitin transferase n=1 Tax=Panicum miliaceum TaxID=4540 RepID=A0A3L6TTS4_PANMI|nr:U-box domain-containing protein 33-like isoform X1 [Panicum miliaceum]